MMLVSVFGTSTPYGYWGFSAVRHVMQVLYGDHLHIHCLGIDDLRQSWAGRDGRPVVFTSDCPDAAIADLLLEFRAPMIVFLDDPADAVAFAMESREIDAKQALSFATHCFCSLNEILTAPPTICFTSRHLGEDVRDIYAELLRILAGAVAPDQLEEVMRRAVVDDRPGRIITVADQLAEACAGITLPAAALSKQSVEIQNLFTATCESYWPIFDRKPLTNVEWPRDLFFSCNDGNAAPELIDLTGPARFLIWGPYLHLPGGDWTAKVAFEVADNFSGSQLQADIYDGQSILVVARTELPRQGVFSFELPFAVHEPHQKIELRICLAQGAIEGKFGLRSVSLLRTEPVICTSDSKEVRDASYHLITPRDSALISEG